MHRIPCSSCGQTVEIAPNAAICSSCGADLVELIPAVGTSQHYYARAETLLSQDDVDGALTVIKDGLETVISSDLLLLGAILAEKVGQYDLMRHYVSRIPVDDSLRIEGEWLLRAHQARQRAHRQGRDPSQAVLEQMTDEFGLPTELVNTQRIRDEHDDESSGFGWRRELVPTFALILLVGLVGLGWFYGDRLRAQPWVPAAFRAEPVEEIAVPQPSPSDGSADLTAGGTNAQDGSASENVSASSSPDATSNGELNVDGDSSGTIATDAGASSGSPSVEGYESQPTIGDVLPLEETDGSAENSNSATESSGETSPTPTVSPDVLLKQYRDSDVADDAANDSVDSVDSVGPPPADDSPPGAPETVPDDVAESATPEPVADASPRSIVEVVVQEPFDILKYLRDIGRPDLAQLPLDAQLVEDKLFVSGVVKWYEEREAIIEALSFAPGVADVNPIGLKIRTPETYAVQEGDTLWIIAFRIYGDGARWPQIYELNQTELASPDALGLRQVLKVPPR